ncbi:hypothetical protein Tco_0657864 [Tanacetum coccineum]
MVKPRARSFLCKIIDSTEVHSGLNADAISIDLFLEAFDKTKMESLENWIPNVGWVPNGLRSAFSFSATAYPVEGAKGTLGLLECT